MQALLAVIAVALAGPGDGGSDAPSLADYLRIRVPETPTRAADGTLYVEDWPDGITQLYRRLPRSLDGEFVRLTEFPDGIDGYRLSPDERTIIVSASEGGSEQGDLYRVDAAGGPARPLLRDPAVNYRFQCWLRDGSGFVYAANDTHRSDFHIYLYDLATASTQKVLAREGAWSAADVTDDGSRLLVGRYLSASRADAFELDIASGELRGLNRGEAAFNRAAFYLPGEQRVALVSDAVGGVRRLYVRSLADGSFVRPCPDLDAWNIEGGAINPDRTLAAILCNEAGYRSMRLLRLPSLETVPLPALEQGLFGQVSLRGSVATWTLTTARDPGRTWTWDVDGDAPPAALTAVTDQDVDLATFVLPRPITYHSFDELEVPGFLFLPPGHEPGVAIPFVVHFHGGPEGQHRPGFDRFVQHLVRRGYGVLQPNVRGSTGYGRSYHMMDNYRSRWDSVRDGAAAARWLVDEGYAEAGRIATYGRSYGGFMAVATVIEDPEVFGAAAEVVGIVNFRTFLEQTGAYRRALREVEYGPLTDPDFLVSVSPIERLAEIRVPVLIAHGLNDPRVPVGEAMQLAVGLQRRGADPDLIFFPDEGHRIAKLDNRILLFERIEMFFDRTIGNVETSKRRNVEMGVTTGGDRD